MPKISRFLLPLLAASAVAACGSGSDGPSANDGGGGTESTVNLAVTDAPVDSLAEVNIQFTGVVFNPAGNGEDEEGGFISYDFDEPRTFDVLALAGGDTEGLLIDEPIPAGDYEWIRLKVNAERGVMDSFVVEDDGGEESLFIPSGSQRGLQLNGPFSVNANQGVFYVVDFDLRKSINNPQGFPDYRMNPVLRIVEVEEAGSIGGSIDPALLIGTDCDADPATGEGAAVCDYEGNDATMGSLGSDSEPLTAARVTLDIETGDFVYTAAFLNAGEYTAAFTCQAGRDDPATQNDIRFDDQTNATVEAGVVTTVDFEAELVENEGDGSTPNAE